ncbi:MAG: cytochrome c [Planctomycetota bacterium]|jgi:hypothetical protein
MISKNGLWAIRIGLVLSGFGALAVVGCNSNGQMTEASPAPSATGEAPMAAGGAELWAQNCIRCHNMRTPAALGDREWQIALHHMRVRAGLTADEHDAILTFLKAAN